MRTLYLPFLLIFIFFAGIAHGQSDTIYQVDRTKIAAIIDEVSTDDLLYFQPQDKTRKNHKIARVKVWKVVYLNGETEIFNSPKPLHATKDKLFLKNGKDIEVSVSEVTSKEVKYVLPNNKEEQLPLSQVEKIVYANGIEHSYAQEPKMQPEASKATPVVVEKNEPAIATPQRPVAVSPSPPVTESAVSKPNELIIKIQHEPVAENTKKGKDEEHKGYVGIRVGGSMTSFYTDKVAWPKQPFLNWEAGLGFSLASSKHYNARMELMYAHKGFRETTTDQVPEITRRTKMTYGQVNLLPLILKGGAKKLNPAIGFGGYYAYRINHVSEIKEGEEDYVPDDVTQGLIDNKFDYGACVMLAFYSGDRPLLEFRYEHGLAEVMKGLKVKNNGLSLSLFLKF